MVSLIFSQIPNPQWEGMPLMFIPMFPTDIITRGSKTELLASLVLFNLQPSAILPDVQNKSQSRRKVYLVLPSHMQAASKSWSSAFKSLPLPPSPLLFPS